MTNWDVFHSEQLEVERGLDTAKVREAMARGALTEDDLIRPAGSGSPWERLGDRLEILTETAEPEPEPEAEAAPEPEPPADSSPLYRTEMDTALHQRFEWSDEEVSLDAEIVDDQSDYEHVDAELSESGLVSFADEDEPKSDDDLEFLDDDEPLPQAAVASGPILPPLDKSVAIPVPGPAPLPWDEEELEAEFDGEDEYDPLEEDEAVAEFTLARGATETVEELDLAAMVDVAFQLVLFFLVTATTVLYKSLEVSKPNADAPPEAAVQGRTKTLDDLKADFILVEMDVSGAIKIDRQPVPGQLSMMALADKLRTLRTDTGRSALLFSADYYTPLFKAIIVYDAANEIGLTVKPAKATAPAVNPPPVIKKGNV